MCIIYGQVGVFALFETNNLEIMSSNNNSSVTGIELLAVLFIGLKLAEVINWSWWLVLAPIWVPTLIGILFAFIISMIKS